MRVHSLFSAVSLVAVGVVNGQELKIPWVEQMMASMTDKFANAVTYAGPTGTVLASVLAAESSSAAAGLARPTSVAKIPEKRDAANPYWLENIAHLGKSAFAPDPSTYKVFRNVKDFGAKGDGVTDDTAAINLAVSSGGRCAPGKCESSTTTPAVVYFPAGTYLISSSIIDYYYTMIIGDANNLPVLKATPNFSGFGLIDGIQYQAGGVLGFTPVNTFFRQIRNLVFDITAIPYTMEATGLHWPTAQATSLQNLVFKMSDVAGTAHRGIFIEGGSGGMMNDLVFYGGLNGVVFGNQQFTSRNLTFYNAVTAINQLWDWGWTYSGISINNCSVGIDFSGTNDSGAQNVGSVTLLDSTIRNTKTAIKTAWSINSQPATAGTLVIENIDFVNVGVGIQGTSSVYLTGGTKTIAAYRQGHGYTPGSAKPAEASGTFNAFPRPASLLRSDKRFYYRSKPQYNNLPLSSFVSVRASGAKGDGVTDDTAIINTVLKNAAAAGKVVFFDAGTYRVTTTVYVPPGSKVVGEAFSVIMAWGNAFASDKSPLAVVQVGKAGEAGVVEWSDMIVSTRGAMRGAILIQWNLNSSPSNPSGMWDVHTRIGGFAGSALLYANCPASAATVTSPNLNCAAAFMSLHLTKTSQGLYLENVWAWVADHDIEDATLRRVTIYAGRGIFSESTQGNFWFVGTGSEHHQLYQYQFLNTPNVFMGQVQTETAYYQPNPLASRPYPMLSGWNDPDFKTLCANAPAGVPCESGYALRIINSRDVYIYGAGFYSFFNNYSTTCSDAGQGASCQTRIFSIEGSNSKVGAYSLNTIGSKQMITINGSPFATWEANQNVYPQTIAWFRNY